jgi:hypothetical protein
MTRKLSLITLAIFIAISLTLLVLHNSAAAGPKLGCKPLDLQVKTGQIFYFTVYVTDTTDLYAWQFDMTYSPTYLEFVRVVHGDHLRQDSAGYYLVQPISATGEIQLAAYTRLAEDVGVDGTGAIAHVFFKAKAETSTSGYNATLNETKLVDRNALDVTYTGSNSYKCKVTIRNTNPPLIQPPVGEVLFLPEILR